ncbi:MAG: pilus assembly protein TadG [Sphingomonadales bacterium]|nr:pilus assembly protein TadG [Sphingomonadales bacterium]
MMLPPFAKAAAARRICALARDVAGNVLAFTAIGLLMIAALIGGAVDLGFTYKAQNRLQGACDAAILAGRRAIASNGYDSVAQAQATAFFNANFVSAQVGTTNTSFTTSSPDNGVTVAGSATTTVPLRIMPLFGRRSITITSNCSGTMGLSNSDVTFVLDTTGSMGQTPTGFSTSKIAALQSSLRSFYTTMANATAGTTARVRYAFVPYSTTVNVGQLLYNQNPAYLVDSWGVQSRVPRIARDVNVQFSNGGSTWYDLSQETYYSTPNSATTQVGTTSYAAMTDCLAAMPADTAWTNNGAATTSTTVYNGKHKKSTAYVQTTQPRVMTSYTCARTGDAYYVYSYNIYEYFYSWTYTGYSTVTATQNVDNFDHFDYKWAKIDTSLFKTFANVSTLTGSNGASVTSNWDGCIEERDTVSDSAFTYNAGSNTISPGGATDLDIDAAPSGESTKWAPMWPDVAFYRSGAPASVSTSGSQATSYCPAAAQLLTTMSQTAFNTYVNSLVASGSTYHDIGMLWGARVSSPTGIFASNVLATPGNGGNVTRHIIYMTDGDPNASNTIQQAYGIETLDRRITDDGTTDDDLRHEARFRAICDAIKGRGIRIWVIGYTTSLTSDLAYCASPNSAFSALTANDLNTAFQTIAQQVGQLRVTG